MSATLMPVNATCICDQPHEWSQMQKKAAQVLVHQQKLSREQIDRSTEIAGILGWKQPKQDESRVNSNPASKKSR